MIYQFRNNVLFNMIFPNHADCKPDRSSNKGHCLPLKVPTVLKTVLQVTSGPNSAMHGKCNTYYIIEIPGTGNSSPYVLRGTLFHCIYMI